MRSTVLRLMFMTWIPAIKQERYDSHDASLAGSVARHTMNTLNTRRRDLAVFEE
jgi:hypothetical protein